MEKSINADMMDIANGMYFLNRVFMVRCFMHISFNKMVKKIMPIIFITGG